MTVRRRVTLVLVVLFEVWLYREYAELGAQFHFWLHSLFGGALGVAGLTLLRVARRRRDGPVAPWETGWIGQLYSAFPDILFLGFGVLHMLWMDVFALHITLHFVPRPLLTMWALFTLTLLGYGLAMSGRPRPALAVLGVSGAVLVAVVAAAPGLPDTIGEVRDHDGLALICPVFTHPADGSAH